MAEKQTSAALFFLGQRVRGRVKRTEILIYKSREETDNIVNRKDGGYDRVTEFLSIAQPNAGTLAKLATLQPSNVSGDRSSHLFYVSKKFHITFSRRCSDCRC